jgi:hypothetical protein
MIQLWKQEKIQWKYDTLFQYFTATRHSPLGCDITQHGRSVTMFYRNLLSPSQIWRDQLLHLLKPFYKTTWYIIPHVHDLNIHHCENHKLWLKLHSFFPWRNRMWSFLIILIFFSDQKKKNLFACILFRLITHM